MTNIAPIANRGMVADSLSGLTEDNRAWLGLLMENPGSDDILLDGLHLYLDRQSEARFLNSLTLSKCGEWLGHAAPTRLQIRLMEAARSGNHPAYVAFREGLSDSGGLERAYPKAEI